MAAQTVVVRDSAGLPISPAQTPPPPSAALFAELPEEGEEEESDLKIYFGSQQNGHRAYRRSKRRARRQRALGEIDSPDRWLISYSDFITLLFAFFVVMYAISQVNESKYRVLSESLIQAFKPQGNLEAKSITENKTGQPSTTPVPAGVIPQAVPNPEIPKRPALPKLRDVELELKKELDPLIQTGDVRVASGTQGLSIELSNKVTFKVGEAAMTFESFFPLRNIARILARNAHLVRVEGHSENEPVANLYPSPWELSAARAARVVRYFIDNGVDPQRLSALGYGDTRLGEAGNGGNGGKGGNRRVSILVLPVAGEIEPKVTNVLPDGTISPNIKEIN